MSSSSTAVLERDVDLVFAKLLSIALIGPDDLRRSDVSSALGEYPGIEVREFSSYPTEIGTVARLLARQFDIVIVDLDSEPKVALDLVESLCGEAAVTVVVYTEEADPERMTRCMRAGAREHLVLPVRQSSFDKAFARARLGLRSGAQPAPKLEPQVVEIPKTDALQDKPLPASAPVRAHDEDLQPASVPASGSADNRTEPIAEPTFAEREQTDAEPVFEVPSLPPWPGGVIIEEIPYTREPAPLTARENDEGSRQKPGAIDARHNGSPAALSQKTAAVRVITEVSVAPTVSNRALTSEVKPRDIFASVQNAPAEAPEIETRVEIGSLSFHSDLDDLGDEDDEDAKRKKLVRIGAVSFVVLVLLLFIGPRLLNPAKHTLAAQSGQAAPVAEVPDTAANPSKPSPSATPNQGRPSAAVGTRPAPVAQPGTRIEDAISPKAGSTPAPGTYGTVLTSPRANSASPQVDSTLMNDQLASAPRIPQDVKARQREEAPPSAGFAAANTEEIASAGAVDNVFGGQARPTIKFVPYPPVVIPVEVAEKLVIHKTLPTYPPHAWNNYASGRVVLEAIVSETGSVESLKVVSGPKVFQQAALDAVKTWRYKPYVINGRQAKIQTTVTLIFDPYKK